MEVLYIRQHHKRTGSVELCIGDELADVGGRITQNVLAEPLQQRAGSWERVHDRILVVERGAVAAGEDQRIAEIVAAVDEGIGEISHLLIGTHQNADGIWIFKPDTSGQERGRDVMAADCDGKRPRQPDRTVMVNRADNRCGFDNLCAELLLGDAGQLQNRRRPAVCLDVDHQFACGHGTILHVAKPELAHYILLIGVEASRFFEDLRLVVPQPHDF